MKYIVSLNGKNYEVEVEETSAAITQITDAPAAPAAPAAQAAPAPASAPAGGGQNVTAPMPGTVLAVKTSQGQTVKAGDVLFILEAMKMENEIVAPCAGTVKQISVQKGASVDTGAVLAVIG